MKGNHVPAENERRVQYFFLTVAVQSAKAFASPWVDNWKNKNRTQLQHLLGANLY
jgi:hypothetical protein